MSRTADALINAIDSGLRTLFATPHASRTLDLPTDNPPLNAAQQRHSASLMRVNHVGEVCAQGLYAAQALGARVFSKDEALAGHLEAASVEENDHLAWTSERLQELKGRPSLSRLSFCTVHPRARCRSLPLRCLCSPCGLLGRP